MKKENYDDIQAMFDSDGVTLPEALFKENMVGKLKEKAGDPASSIRPIRPKRKLAAILSAAAVLALIITAVAVSSKTGKPTVAGTTVAGTTVAGTTVPDTLAAAEPGTEPETEPEPTEAESEPVTDESGLMSFQSEDEFVRFLSANLALYGQTTVAHTAASPEGNIQYSRPASDIGTNDVPKTYGYAADGAVASGSAQENFASAPAADKESGTSYSETNTQVDGVDEADIIKNDGRYLYVISEESRLSVVDTQSMKTVFVKELDAVNGGEDYTAIEMYLTDNRLVVLGSQYKKGTETDDDTVDYVYSSRSFRFPYETTETVISLFDISDKNHISLVTSFTQDGNYNNSRLVDGYVYLISDYRLMSRTDLETKAIPSVKNQKVPCGCVYVLPGNDDYACQTVISGFSVTEKDPTVSTLSLVGYSDEIYCTTDTLYLLSRKYTNGEDQTDIFSFRLLNGTVEKKTKGTVPGFVDNNYSLDEKDGYLRITTTAYDFEKDEDVSSLYVLDETLKTVGKLTDIAPDEQIKSTRFLGNIAYVVTFRNTDPLFAIDVSDPKNPKVLGEVKLPGFSEYLHPLGDDLLVGIGYDGDDEDADFESLKITLFDISDPLHPTVKDSLSYKNTDSNVLSSPKSFIMGESDTDFFIPAVRERERFNRRTQSYDMLFTYRYLHISAENGKLTELTAYTVPETTDDYLYDFTGAYIGENFYACADGEMYRYSIASGENTAKVDLDELG
ncbi:MAG: beta-propeller domain-containing protein [Oscillospiraceae bacterium]|nr:beta-propeller domain-containing protein [Oscillospiraceae bacterium]